MHQKNKNNFHGHGSLSSAISNSSSKGPNILPVYKKKTFQGLKTNLKKAGILWKRINCNKIFRWTECVFCDNGFRSAEVPRELHGKHTSPTNKKTTTFMELRWLTSAAPSSSQSTSYPFSSSMSELFK